MEKIEKQRLFYKAVDTIEYCSDVIVKNQLGVVIERGMALSDDVFFSYVLDKGTIRLYVDNEEVFEIDKDSPILEAFRCLLDNINDLD